MHHNAGVHQTRVAHVKVASYRRTIAPSFRAEVSGMAGPTASKHLEMILPRLHRADDASLAHLRPTRLALKPRAAELQWLTPFTQVEHKPARRFGARVTIAELVKRSLAMVTNDAPALVWTNAAQTCSALQCACTRRAPQSQPRGRGTHRLAP